ncbi:MAG: nitroreductase family protein [Thalassobius sp.]|nr:nitroreductase family protein [Thalassovita sp.]
MEESNLFIPFRQKAYEGEALVKRVSDFYTFMNQRRSLREFSSKPVPKEVIEKIIMTASSAPSGANKQPWTFCAISNPEVKKQIREAAEKEEKINYSGRMSDSWLQDLKPFATDEHKPFLEIAPWIIVVFKRSFEVEKANKKNNYYVSESVGLAAGFLLTAIHNAGLVALTHTPSPMNFLVKVLDRPKNEKPYLLIPVGYAPENATVPDIKRKSKEEVIVFYE